MKFNSKIILLFVFAILAGLVFVFIFTTGTKKPQEKSLITAPTLQKDKDYSSLYKTIPGKSTQEDVIKINGAPQEIKKEGLITYFYYRTPYQEIKNIVSFKDNVELYAVENIFADYRGDFESFLKAYGQSLKFYDEGSPFVWHIFLKHGIGIEGNEKDITKILYFVPQEKEDFLENIAGVLGLIGEPKGEVLHP